MYFKHTPALGGAEEGQKYQGIYNQTLGFYRAVFNIDPVKEIWEPTNERFSPDIFNCSNVNLQRLTCFLICQAKQPQGQFFYMNTLRRKRLQELVTGKIASYERKYSTERRMAFIMKRREIRR